MPDSEGLTLEPRLSIIERALVIMDSNLLPGLTSEDLARVASRTTEVHVEAGDPIDIERGIYLLIEGKVEVLLDGRVIRHVAPGGGIGLASALGIEERQGFSSRAADHSHLLTMTGDDLHDVMTEFPDVAVALLKHSVRTTLILTRRLEEADVSVSAAVSPSEPAR